MYLKPIKIEIKEIDSRVFMFCIDAMLKQKKFTLERLVIYEWYTKNIAKMIVPKNGKMIFTLSPSQAFAINSVLQATNFTEPALEDMQRFIIGIIDPKMPLKDEMLFINQ